MHKIGKWMFTNVALGLLGATIVISLISLFLGFSVYWDIRFYLSYHQALAAYSSDRMEVAIPAIDKAVSYRGDFAPARVLKAKMLIDSVTSDTASLEALNEAEALLRDKVGVLKSGPAAASVHLMLAAVHLKRFDVAKAQKQPAEAELKDALSAMEEAETKDSENPDLHIMRAHLDFRRGDIAAAEKRLAEAAKLIQEARTEERIPTIDMMVDFYVGLMVVADRKADFSEARANANRVLMLRPDWTVPLANQASFEARRLADGQVPKDEFDARANDFQAAVTNLVEIARRDPSRSRWALDAAYGLSQSIGIYYSHSGNFEAAHQVFFQTVDLDPQRGEALWTWIESAYEARKREGMSAGELHSIISHVRATAYPRFSKMELPLTEQAVAYNNLAVHELTVRGDIAETENMLRLAEKKLEHNKACAPQVYRNLAVLLDSLKRTDDVVPLIKKLRESGPGPEDAQVADALATKYGLK